MDVSSDIVRRRFEQSGIYLLCVPGRSVVIAPILSTLHWHNWNVPDGCLSVNVNWTYFNLVHSYERGIKWPKDCCFAPQYCISLSQVPRFYNTTRSKWLGSNGKIDILYTVKWSKENCARWAADLVRPGDKLTKNVQWAEPTAQEVDGGKNILWMLLCFSLETPNAGHLIRFIKSHLRSIFCKIPLLH